MGLRFLEQLATSGIGDFEGLLAGVPFELLSEVVDLTLDLIEFITGFGERKQKVKGSVGNITIVTGNDVALEGGRVVGMVGHGITEWEVERQRRIRISPFPAYTNLPTLHTTT
jgi:hypothetical protein